MPRTDPNAPHDINDSWWWYEDARGIGIYYNDGNGHAANVTISWRALRAALKRKDGEVVEKGS